MHPVWCNKHWIRLIPLVIGLTVGTIVLMLWFVDPAHAVWMPKCAFKMLTNLDCPSCGVTRAAHAILHGNIKEAIRFNYFLVVTLPYLFITASVVLFSPMHKSRIRRIAFGKTVGIIYVILFFAWWIIRNMDWFKDLI